MIPDRSQSCPTWDSRIGCAWSRHSRPEQKIRQSQSYRQLANYQEEDVIEPLGEILNESQVEAVDGVYQTAISRQECLTRSRWENISGSGGNGRLQGR